jgi:hypothetical protein
LKQIGESLQKGLKGECKELFISYLEIYGMYAEDIRAEFKLEEGHILLFENIRATFYNGTITGSVKVTLGETVAYRVQLAFESVDFRWFAMNFFDPGTEFRGKIKGTFNVSGNENGDVHGKLNLTLKDGYIGRLPRWFAMFTLVNVNPLRSNDITEARLRLSIEKDKFVIKHCLMDSNDYTVTGQGEIGFDGYAKVTLIPIGKHPLISWIPIFPLIVKWAEKALRRIHINGPIFAPQYRIFPLFKL